MNPTSENTAQSTVVGNPNQNGGYPERISKHISYVEATHSQTAIKYRKENIPNEEQLTSMRLIAEKVFEPIRAHFKAPIAITSFFRSKQVNTLVGGSLNSQHTKGEAMDINAAVLGGVTNTEIFFFIKNNLLFDQLIWEFGDDKNPDWVHVSYKNIGNRRQILKSKQNGHNTKYELWIG
jgi:hypothetical protein